MHEDEKRWVAAAIDFEGTIHIGKHLKGNSSYYESRIQVTNTKEALIDELVKICGGKKLFVRRPGNRQDHWVWYCAARYAEELLKEVYPYLIAKKEQANVFFELRQTVSYKNTHPVDKEILNLREVLRLKMGRLNQRGKLNYGTT